MSPAAVVAAIQVASAAYAAFNVIQGLKKGNLMQAVLGGVSAYFAFSGLGAMTSVQSSTAQGATGVANPGAALQGTVETGAQATAGTATAGNTGVSQAFTEGFGAESGSLLGDGNMLGEAITEQGMGNAIGPKDPFGLAGELSEGLGGVSSDALTNIGTQQGLVDTTTGAATKTTGDSALGDFWDKFGAARDFLKENPEIVKTGGSIFENWSKGQAQEEMYKRRLEEQERRRRRMGRSVRPETSLLGWRETSQSTRGVR
jgi:hypothetical protein